MKPDPALEARKRVRDATEAVPLPDLAALEAAAQLHASLRPPRLTRHGVAFILLTATAGILAVVLGSHYIFLLFGTLFSMFLVATLHARLMLRGVRVQRTVQHPVFSHQPFQVSLRFLNDKWLPVACLRVNDGPRSNDHVRHDAQPEVFVPVVPPQGESTVTYRSRLFGRGWAEWTHVTVATDAPFGLFRSEVSLPCPGRELVYPRVLPVIAQMRIEALFAPTEIDVTVGQRGSEEFVGLREFRGGDNPRWIHWKASARLPSQLLVREFDSPRIRRVVLAVESCVGTLERRKLLRRLENSVTIAASLAGTLVRNTPSLTFLTASPEPRILELSPDSRSLWELLESLALLEPSQNLAIRDLLALLPAAKLEGAAVIAVTLRTEPELLAEYPGMVLISAERPSHLLLQQDRRSGLEIRGGDRWRGGDA